jgi:hypothetical protein
VFGYPLQLSQDSYLNDTILKQAAVTPTPVPCPGLRVMVGNSNQVGANGLWRVVPLHISGGHDFRVDYFAIPLGGFDIVVMTWLR